MTAHGALSERLGEYHVSDSSRKKISFLVLRTCKLFICLCFSPFYIPWLLHKDLETKLHKQNALHLIEATPCGF